LEAPAKQLAEELQRMNTVINSLSAYAIQGDIERYLSDATVFMEMASLIVIGWQWLKMAVLSSKKLLAKDFKLNSQDFYNGKIHCMEFFFKYELPHAEACAKTLEDTHTLTNIKNFEMF